MYDFTKQNNYNSYSPVLFIRAECIFLLHLLSKQILCKVISEPDYGHRISQTADWSIPLFISVTNTRARLVLFTWNWPLLLLINRLIHSHAHLWEKTITGLLQLQTALHLSIIAYVMINHSLQGNGSDIIIFQWLFEWQRKKYFIYLYIKGLSTHIFKQYSSVLYKYNR